MVWHRCWCIPPNLQLSSSSKLSCRWRTRATRCITANGKILEQSLTKMIITTPIYVVLFVTLDIAYLCKKFDDANFSYSRCMFRALNLKCITWLNHAHLGQFFVLRLGLAMIDPHTKFEGSTITCNKDMKCDAKICK